MAREKIGPPTYTPCITSNGHHGMVLDLAVGLIESYYFIINVYLLY